MDDLTGFDAVRDVLGERIQSRFLPGESIPDSNVVDEFSRTIYDRVLIQIDADELPELGLSIVVDATMKALRLRGYEGSTSESNSDGGSISNNFVDDVLASYKADISALKLRAKNVGAMGVKLI